jgi:hypothetical protein
LEAVRLLWQALGCVDQPQAHVLLKVRHWGCASPHISTPIPVQSSLQQCT